MNTRRGLAVRLAAITTVAVGMTLTLAGVSAADPPRAKPSQATSHSRGTDHRGAAQPTRPAVEEEDTTGDDAPARQLPTAPSAAPTYERRAGDTAPVNGDNGTVKVHRSDTPADDRRNEPQVCSFYLVGFNFDPQESVWWRIRSWPPTGDRAVVASGTLGLDAHGHGRTSDMSLSDGHYKLFWKFEGEKGRAKQKVFWVRCTTQSPAPSASTSPAAPTGTAPGAQPPAGEPPSENRGMLPFTGFPIWLAVALALALLLGGATMVAATRRRG